MDIHWLLGLELPKALPDWIGAAITVALVMGPAWVIFRSRAIKEELKLLREGRAADKLAYEEQIGELKAALSSATARIDAMEASSAERVADHILARFEREGLFDGRSRR